MIFKKKESENTSSKKQKNNLFRRYLNLIIGCALLAFSFDVFFAPENIVYGGISGMSILIDRLFGIDKSLFVLVVSIILLFISFFTLGWEKTKGSIAGSIIYPVFIKLFEPIAFYMGLNINNILLVVIFGSIISGLGLGINFKSGFSTGGSDIINQIISKYARISIGKAMLITDGIIILGSGFFLTEQFFAFENVMYAIMVLYIISLMVDKVILGISQCKAFYIVTEYETSVKKFIMEHFSSGITVLDGRGGYTGNFQKVIMCIVPTKDYIYMKEGILEIDPDAFFLVTDAYEVSGGRIRR